MATTSPAAALGEQGPGWPLARGSGCALATGAAYPQGAGAEQKGGLVCKEPRAVAGGGRDLWRTLGTRAGGACTTWGLLFSRNGATSCVSLPGQNCPVISPSQGRDRVPAINTFCPGSWSMKSISSEQTSKTQNP